MFWILFVVCPVLLNCAWSHEGEDGGHEHFIPANADGFRDGRLASDSQHIREDLEAYFNVSNKDFSKMSQDELRFFYFELHDFDKNGKLDGLEMMRAVMHVVEHDKHTVPNPDAFTGVEKFAIGIDDVLKHDDLDSDGFLTYEEFAYAQQGYSQEHE